MIKFSFWTVGIVFMFGVIYYVGGWYYYHWRLKSIKIEAVTEIDVINKNCSKNFAEILRQDKYRKIQWLYTNQKELESMEKDIGCSLEIINDFTKNYLIIVPQARIQSLSASFGNLRVLLKKAEPTDTDLISVVKIPAYSFLKDFLLIFKG